MRRIRVIAILSVLSFSVISIGAEEEPLQGFTAEHSTVERQWETKFRALPSADNQREYMRRLTARPRKNQIMGPSQRVDPAADIARQLFGRAGGARAEHDHAAGDGKQVLDTMVQLSHQQALLLLRGPAFGDVDESANRTL